jgi:hypothetical protein
LLKILLTKGFATSVIEATNQVMAPRDAEMVGFVHDEILAKIKSSYI